MLQQGKNVNSGFVRVRRVFYTIKMYIVFLKKKSTFTKNLERWIHL